MISPRSEEPQGVSTEHGIAPEAETGLHEGLKEMK